MAVKGTAPGLKISLRRNCTSKKNKTGQGRAGWKQPRLVSFWDFSCYSFARLQI